MQLLRHGQENMHRVVKTFLMHELFIGIFWITQINKMSFSFLIKR